MNQSQQITSSTRTNQNVLDEIRLLITLLGHFPPETKFPERLSREEINELISCMLASGDFLLIGATGLGDIESGNVLAFKRSPRITGEFLCIHIYTNNSFLRLINSETYRYVDLLAPLGNKEAFREP